jgi:NTE family protein
MTEGGGATGLVLTGGGARGAYQAGALHALAEIVDSRSLPFPILAASSAGAINAAYLAAGAPAFVETAGSLFDLWGRLSPDHVFRTDPIALAKSVARWSTDLGLGGWLGAGRGHALLDTTPLHELLKESFDAAAIGRNIAANHVAGLALSTTSYGSGHAVTFFQSKRTIAGWTRATRSLVPATIGLQHVLASSAIPVFFPAECIDGEWYADGSIRLTTPLSPAIALGADRILAITVRAAYDVPSPAPAPRAAVAERPAEATPYPPVAQMLGVLLDSLFLDALDLDVELAERINRTLTLLTEEAYLLHEGRLLGPCAGPYAVS